jgi:hypothetical protein
MWSWVPLERPQVVQPLGSFPAFNGTRRFITPFTRTLHLYLSWARPIQSFRCTYMSHIISRLFDVLPTIQLCLYMSFLLWPFVCRNAMERKWFSWRPCGAGGGQDTRRRLPRKQCLERCLVVALGSWKIGVAEELVIPPNKACIIKDCYSFMILAVVWEGRNEAG